MVDGRWMLVLWWDVFASGQVKFEVMDEKVLDLEGSACIFWNE